jgi:predicted ATP-binding protein involved in virulence
MQRVNQDTGSIRLLIESSNGNEIERIFEADNKDGDVDKRDEWLLKFLELDRVDSDEAHKRDIQEVLLRALTKTIN